MRRRRAQVSGVLNCCTPPERLCSAAEGAALNPVCNRCVEFLCTKHIGSHRINCGIDVYGAFNDRHIPKKNTPFSYIHNSMESR